MVVDRISFDYVAVGLSMKLVLFIPSSDDSNRVSDPMESFPSPAAVRERLPVPGEVIHVPMCQWLIYCGRREDQRRIKVHGLKLTDSLMHMPSITHPAGLFKHKGRANAM